MDFYRLLQFSTMGWLMLLLYGCQPAPQQGLVLLNTPGYSASLSTDGRYALVSNAEGVYLWQTAQQKPQYHWVQGKGDNTVIATDISASSRFAATLSRDSVALWKIIDGSTAGWWSLPATAQCVAVADNGNLLVGLSDGSVMALNLQAQVLIKFLGHTEKINSVAISADGNWALTGGNDAKVMLWHTNSAQIQQQWQLASRVMHVALAENGQFLLMADSSGNAWIRQQPDGKLISKLQIEQRLMNFSAARFIQQNKRLLTGTPAREVQLWQVDSGKKIASWQVSLPPKPLPQSAVVYSVSEWGHDGVQSLSSSSVLERWQIPKQR